MWFFGLLLQMGDFVFRLVISDTDIRKVRLPEKPTDIASLNMIVKAKTGVESDFILLYEDKEFNNDLCTLSDMEDLQPFGTVRLVEVHSEQQLATQCDDGGVIASHSSSHMRQSSGWPKEFAIPDFDYDVELLLSAGNSEYKHNGKLLNLSKSAKGAVLKKLVCAIYEIKSYPTEAECNSVASALIAKYPCLREPGSVTGYGGWRNSIQFKMGNYRNEIRKAGGMEVAVNAGKRSRFQPDLPASRKGIKKPKRSESNYLPNLPSGENRDSQEDIRKTIAEEFRKVARDQNVIRTMMAKTFAFRRQSIVNDPQRISALVLEWPALFDKTEVSFIDLLSAVSLYTCWCLLFADCLLHL